jgi:hypothetical protein
LLNLSLGVGQLVIEWAFVEQVLDMCIAVIYHHAGGKHIDPIIPRSVKRKVRFLKLCFKTIKAAAPFKDEALPLLSEAKTLAHTRHTVVHGVLSEYDDATGTVTFVMLDPRADAHYEVRRKLDFQQMLTAGDKCRILMGQLRNLTRRLIRALVPEDEADDLPPLLLGKTVRPFPIT